jgi:hypothetical protein
MAIPIYYLEGTLSASVLFRFSSEIVILAFDLRLAKRSSKTLLLFSI